MEDDWDSIDWDEKVEDIKKEQQKEEKVKEREKLLENAPAVKFSEEDGNYFETNKQKKKLKDEKDRIAREQGMMKSDKSKEEVHLQPYSSKDLERIINFTKSTKFHNLMYETFGQLERFLLTHEQHLTDEMIVELLNIDVTLLEVPFSNHNELLLESLSNLSSFWLQLVQFLQDFLLTKHKDVKFLLAVDLNGFFDNIEIFFHNLLVNNFFNSSMESVFEKIKKAMEDFPESKWSHPERLEKLQVQYFANLNDSKVYDIYPTLADLAAVPELLENVVEGEYPSVSNYLKVQIPLLKEDFVGTLRSAIKDTKLKKSEGTKNSSAGWVHEKVQIVPVTKFMWNMNCRLITVNLKSDQKSNWSKRFFVGQMLCFSSTRDFNDLIVALINSREQSGDKTELIIEIIRTENITSIFKKDLIMVETVTFFEPYHRVFNVMKNLNEINFSFKNQVLNLTEAQNSSVSHHSDQISYKNLTFNAKALNDWPSSKDLGLEDMQLKAVQAAVTNEFTLIQGPPGTGKTFVGLEILKILLDNTDETILVLTQTNNALDKFLLGALSFTKSIIRCGGQCKSEELEPFVLKPETPLESKKYMKKLQAEHRDEVEKLMKSDDNHQEIQSKISKHFRLIEEIHQLSSFYSIKRRRVIGMTTTYAAKNCSFNKMVKPGIVLIEEASEVLESHVLVSLTKDTKQVIMIGDHQQLRPLTSNFELSKNFHFNVSLFERMIKNGFNYTTLDVQMRMHPEICDLVRGTIYKSLKDGANVAAHPEVTGMPKSFFCVNHSSPESVGDGETSKVNQFEAEYVIQLCNHLINQGNEASSMTILTAYAAQAQLIKRRLKDRAINVRVAVLDNYQGEEADIILLSLVRSNSLKDIGFLSTENRIAVILSRARFGFYIVANMDCLASASKNWKKVKAILEEKQLIGDKIPDIDISFN